MEPPYHAEAFPGAFAVIYNAGTKENAGIFSQSQGWVILAEVRVLEPYCYGQFTEGKDSPNFGHSHVHWLTGTASTIMVGCVEGILGMRPDFKGLKIAPAIPKEWEQVEIENVIIPFS